MSSFASTGYRIEDVGHLLRLFYYIHPSSESMEIDDKMDTMELIKVCSCLEHYIGCCT